MCGIAGFNFEDKKLLRSMCDSISHRGPDDSGYYTDKNISIGNRRLSIIDLSKGKQPIHNEDETIWVVFNGEIYNFKDLKDELEKFGHKFYTDSDTEVLVHAYEQYKEDFIKLLRGMFAFCIYDKNENKLIIGRDRAGKKPLYYLNNPNRFLFASELKALLCDEELKKEINQEALYHYLTYGYVPTPLSILKGIKKLEPGHYLVLKDKQITIEKYWDINYNEIKGTEDYFKKRVYEILKDSVKARLVSDVPLGALLSGGIDSSTIVGLMSQLTDNVKTFSVGFNEKDFDELKYARIVSEKFNTDHKEFIVNADLIKDIPMIAWHLDEPFVDPSALPTYYVSKIARQHVKVVLSGDGGDELFAGYTRYEPWAQDKALKYYSVVPGFLRKGFGSFFGSLQNKTGNPFYRKAKKVSDLSSLNKEEQWLSKLNLFNENEKKELYINKHELTDSYKVLDFHFKNCNSGNILNRKLYADFKTFLLDDGLHKVDRMSSAVSLEVRSPFLDHYVIDFASSIPASLKIKKGIKKYILKKAVSDLLPKEIMEREKQGFDVPIKYWIKSELKNLVNTNLIKDIKTRNYFSSEYVKKIINEHNEGKRDNSRRVWALLMFELWNKIYMDGTDFKKIKF
ncbi:asparagine synthase (glutamine-hydrolyzing) [Candidatus Woesearchaeota archaeon]|nr:asparagine synthase (glutamine-hydrolyzing) [Candidatus Woesearchaeota archaeon]